MNKHHFRLSDVYSVRLTRPVLERSIVERPLDVWTSADNPMLQVFLPPWKHSRSQLSAHYNHRREARWPIVEGLVAKKGRRSNYAQG